MATGAMEEEEELASTAMRENRLKYV